MSYVQKWIASQVFPVFALSLVFAGIGASCLLRGVQAGVAEWRGARDGGDEGGGGGGGGARGGDGEMHIPMGGARGRAVLAGFVDALAGAGDAVIGAMFTLLYYTYMITVSRSLEVRGRARSGRGARLAYRTARARVRGRF